NSDIVISSITYTEELLGEDSWFKEGVLVIPVHLRGFQNCDLFFDKIYGDDYNQIKGFQYFNQFKYFAEVAEVLRGEKIGRTSHNERILSYNIGMSLHDIFAASKIYNYFETTKDILKLAPNSRYWL
ncbi:MAG: ornithine cyclodeaminase, partial [Oscillospiraceae bacterium]|nr:ornithine cyclodeaminase [Oscillospiraceae bacterium]